MKTEAMPQPAVIDRRLRLVEMIRQAGVELGSFKIHCATGQATSPLRAFQSGQFREWQEDQRQRNFECDRIVSLIHLGGSRWLFAGVFEVLGVDAVEDGRYRYRTRELGELDHLTGKAIIDFDKRFRASYLLGDNHTDAMRLIGLHEQRMAVADFPGYGSVCIDHDTLKAIVEGDIESWRVALGNVSGVYVIADRASGRLYVGSACGVDGIWGRWTEYASTGHGGNVELRSLIVSEGESHAQHFQFSLLEVCGPNASSEFILGREAHWKEVLQSRVHGLNRN